MPAQTKSSTSNQPTSSRPVMPAGFGISKKKTGLLAWNWADERLQRALNYWIATTRPDGRPHVMPVWGLWIEQKFFFGTPPETRKARNLALNPSLTLHLDNADEVVIVEGTVTIEKLSDHPLLNELSDESKRKYGMPVSPESSETIYALHPRIVFGWETLRIGVTATRWSFDNE